VELTALKANSTKLRRLELHQDGGLSWGRELHSADATNICGTHSSRDNEATSARTIARAIGKRAEVDKTDGKLQAIDRELPGLLRRSARRAMPLVFQLIVACVGGS